MEAVASTVIVKIRAAKVKLKLIRILAALFIANTPCPGREGRAQQHCEPTIAEAFGTVVFVTFSGEKAKLLIAEHNAKVRDDQPVEFV